MYTLISALILGFTGFILGFVGPIIVAPDANQGPLLGIFITGPAGAILGAIIGFVVGFIKKRNPTSILLKIWKRALWLSAILSVAVIAFAWFYIPWQESKYSNIINSSSDLQKRDKSLKNLRVRSLSDDELVQLKQFPALNDLDFFSGWKREEAKLTDIGLKNISELNLPRLEYLMLGYCNKITDAGMKFVARIQTLKHLNLAACPQITDAGLANLATSTSIETLDLRGCVGITDKGLGNLTSMSNVKEIWLGGCKNITATGVDALRKALPNKKIEKDDKEWAYNIK